MFQEFIDSLPNKIRCTNNFEDGTTFRNKEDALGFKYIEHNQLYKKYIVVDVDRNNSPFLWEKVNLPPPTIITISPGTARCHYLWQLNTPVIYTEAGRSKAQHFYENVDIALTRAIPGADPYYVGKFTKNPVHNFWKSIYHPTSYDLGDFEEYLDVIPFRKRRQIIWNCEGRNATLFDQVRRWGYVAVKSAYTYMDFQCDIDNKAIQVNQQFQTLPEGLLMLKEVLSTARSIGKWTWKHRFDNFTNRGIMNLPQNMKLREKQKLAALYSNTQRTSSTINKILNSVQCLKSRGTPITQKSVSIDSGISLDTVKRNWKNVEKNFNIYAY